MDLKPGSRWRSAACSAEVVVIRPPAASATLQCGGHPMVAHGAERPQGLALTDGHRAGAAAGKRYVDAGSGLEVLCSKTGEGSLALDGRALPSKEAKALPASD